MQGRRRGDPRGWRACLLGLLLIGCAVRAPGGSPPEPVPPPRGTPPPRLDPAPDPAPAPEATPDDPERRFPVLEGRAREEARQREARRAEQRVELVEVPGDACAEVPEQEQLRCPIPPTAVEAVENVPRGIRLHFRAGSVVAAPLRRALACQLALARRPATTPACPFLRRETGISLRERRGRVVVDLLAPDEERAGTLRAEARRAFPRAEEAAP